MVKDHEGARRPQDGENGSNGEENGGGLAGRVAPKAETVAASPQLPHNNSIEGEENSAGKEVDSSTVGPDQDVLGHGSPVALSSFSTTILPR